MVTCFEDERTLAFGALKYAESSFHCVSLLCSAVSSLIGGIQNERSAKPLWPEREKERERKRGGWQLDSPEHISWTKSSAISVLRKWHFTGLETSLLSLQRCFLQGGKRGSASKNERENNQI